MTLRLWLRCVSIIVASVGLVSVGAQAQTQTTPGWRFHGAARAAVGLSDSSSKAGVSFATTDLRMTFSVTAKDFVTLTELEGVAVRIENEAEEELVRVRRAHVGYEPSSNAYRVHVGRLLLSGATRIGTEAVTRRNDEAFGAVDGLRLEAGGGKSAFRVGVVAGNTLGLYGASSNMADEAMSVDFAALERDDGPKAARAAVAYADSCFGPVCGDLWYGAEKNYFSKAPTTTADAVATGATPDGVVYANLKHAEVGLRTTSKHVNAGGWYRRVWLQDPEVAALKPGGAIARADGAAGKSFSTETYGVGAEWLVRGAPPPGEPAPGSAFVGLSLAANRTATEDLGKDSAAAKAEEDRDLRQIGLSVGWRDQPAMISLNVLANTTAGPVFPNKDRSAEAKKNRTVVYSAFSFAM